MPRSKRFGKRRLDEFERLLRLRLRLGMPDTTLSPLEREVIAEQRKLRARLSTLTPDREKQRRA